jgi:diadenosine tetraphosphate (Ap4A) HIT family hydrolase
MILKPCNLCHAVRAQVFDSALDSEHWLFTLQPRPLLVAGQGLIVLKRHCESVSDLTQDELRELGPFMANVDGALRRALNPIRVHFGLYGEQVPHLHLHVLPRDSSLPRGNIRVTFLTAWYRCLATLRLRQPIDSDRVRSVNEKLRAVSGS